MLPQSREIHTHWSPRTALYHLLDAACILAGVWLASTLVQDVGNRTVLLAGFAAVSLYFCLAEAFGIYRSWRGDAFERELLTVVSTWLIVLPLLAFASHLLGHRPQLERQTAGVWFALAAIGLAGSRIARRCLLTALQRHGISTRGCAIIGVNDLGLQLSKNIDNAQAGLRFVGFFDDRTTDRLPDVPIEDGQLVGDLDRLLEMAKRGEVSRIYITFPMRAEERIRRVLRKLSDSTASVYIVPDFFVFELLHSRWTTINGLPAVSIFENPFYGVDGLVKRAEDLLLGTLFLLFAAIPMLIIALLVKCTSPGPVLFRQRRYGLDGREIMTWKFRSMRVCEDGAVVTQATKNDPRVTPLGAFLRKSSLDELPQIFNVLSGSMSLVGPRPHANAHNETYRQMIDGYMLRHKVRPGITGLAQVNGWRGETDTLEKMENRVKCDHQYIREWSLAMDLKILLRTVFVVFSKQNAY